MQNVDEGRLTVGGEKGQMVQGAPKKRRFRSTCLWILVVLCILAMLASGLGVAVVIPKIVTGFAFQRALYYKGSVEVESEIVRPLISADQTFDLAVTVWLRTEEEVDDVEELLRLNSRSMQLPPAIPLYSDVVFRGLRLQDKNKFATVNFTLPTTYFRNSFLTKNDLRGSVVIIPSSPSPLDQIIDYSTWIPNFIKVFPVRSWPFPLGSTDERNKTIADKAIESFGVSVPLLRFHNIGKRCNDTDDDFYDEDDGQISETTKNKNPLTHHPYIVTRTQIRMVDETTPFDKHTYLNKHRMTRQISCGQLSILFPSIHDCDRTYIDVGHVETAMTLNQRIEGGGLAMVYAPYLSLSKVSGPKDLVPVPVHRQFCSSTEDAVQAAADDKETIDVSWNLAFSGRTFTKFAILEEVTKMDEQTMFDMELGEHRQVLDHDMLELTRTLLLAGSKAIEAIAPDIAAAMVSNDGINDWLGTLFGIMMSLLPTFFMLKLVFRIRGFGREGTIWQKLIPVRALSTHEERASQRLDDRMSYWIKGIFYPVIPAILPDPQPDDYVHSWLIDNWPYFVFPMSVLGTSFQLYLNWQSRSFAGNYKVTTRVSLALQFVGLVEYIPGVIGPYDARPRFVAHQVLLLVFVLIEAWQATNFPRVDQDIDASSLFHVE
ncbi:hypothetical protein DXG01_009487 [Tephrocybe rancida]|nr:hypothetical protein DXG01_009487 [Tephrocybe rancida]